MKNNQIKIFVILLAILLTLQLSRSDAKVDTFVKEVKGGGYVIDAIQTKDGNYIWLSRPDTGYTTYFVRKVTPAGKLIWERTLFAQVDFEHGGYWGLESITQIGEGYALIGWAVYDDIEPSAAIVVVLHSDGTVNWNKQFVLPFGFGGTAAAWFASVVSTP